MTTPSATALRSHGHTRPHSRSGGACYLPIKFEIRDVHTHKGITKALLFSQEIIKAEWLADQPRRDRLAAKRKRLRAKIMIRYLGCPVPLGS